MGLKFKLNEPVIVNATGKIGTIKKIRPNEVMEYTVKLISGEIFRHSQFELSAYKFEQHETEIELPKETVIEVDGEQVYPPKEKKKRVKKQTSFLDKMEIKDEG